MRYPVAYRRGDGERPEAAGSQRRRKKRKAFVGPLPVIAPLAPAVAVPAAAATVPAWVPLALLAGIGAGGLVLWHLLEEDPLPDTSIGPEGWNNSDWTWIQCNLTCGGGSHHYRGATSAGVCPENSVEGDCTTTGHVIGDNFPDPDGALDDFPGATWIRVDQPHTTLEDRYVTLGNLRLDGSAGDVWEQALLPPVLVPGYGTPIRVRTDSPMEMPIMKPIGVPIPKRWDEAVAQPGTQPSLDPKRGTRPGTRPGAPRRVSIPPFPFPVVVLPPRFDTPDGPVIPQPDTVVVTTPAPGSGGDAPPVVTTRPGNPQARPPRKNEHEKKTTKKTVQVAGWTTLNVFGEGLDFLDVLHDAIDPSVRPHKKGWRRNKDGTWDRLDWNDKLRDIYDHWREIDVADALAGFVNNQLEDYFYGQLGRAGGKASRDLHVPFGLNTALRKGQNAIADAGGDAIPLPEITFDHETGQFSLALPDGTVVPLGSKGKDFGEVGRYTGYG